jgi:hypothetical protein
MGWLYSRAYRPHTRLKGTHAAIGVSGPWASRRGLPLQLLPASFGPAGAGIKAPCYYYCTNLDYSSLESGNVEALHYGGAGPYNFASLYGKFMLKVTDVHGIMPAKSNIDLSKVDQVLVGIWLKTNGENIYKPQECTNIVWSATTP